MAQNNLKSLCTAIYIQHFNTVKIQKSKTPYGQSMHSID